MNVLDLFSGIGGFSLGLERAGMRTVAFCEIEPWCRSLLAKHWPGVQCSDDVTTREFHEGEADIICGGFPCQDISLAGAGAGLTGERSGLYRHLVRAIRMVRPRFAILENVAALLARGMGDVLGDLAEIGYDTEWHCISARAVGAPHLRDRVWIVANTDRGRWASGQPTASAVGHGNSATASGGDVANSVSSRLEGGPILAGYIADELAALERGCEISIPDVIDDDNGRHGASEVRQQEPSGIRRGQHWFVEPDVGRVADGVPSRVDRLKGLGNAVVPQIPEIIGRAIMLSLTN